MMGDELKATGDYYYGDQWRWQVRIEEDGRQWIHPEVLISGDEWAPSNHDWVLPGGVVLVRVDTLDALRAENAALKAQWKLIPWAEIKECAGEENPDIRAYIRLTDWLERHSPKELYTYPPGEAHP